LKAIILDTSAFIQGFNTSDTDTHLYTTPLVIAEIKEELAKIRAQNWSRTGKLIIMPPTQKSLDHVKNQANNSGDINYLSNTDLSILALSQQLTLDGLTPIIISDDYSIQNLADLMGLSYTGMITQGIKQRLQWINYCPGCKKQYKNTQKLKICSICGTKLKRKPLKKLKLPGNKLPKTDFR
jgi:UPF0271 protein